MGRNCIKKWSQNGRSVGRSIGATRPWGFGSKYTDSLTGWVNFGKRYYSPQWGRWLTRDPKGEVDSSNLYAYLLNDPLLYRDLWGLEKESGSNDFFKNSADIALSSFAPGYDLAKSFYVDKDHPEAWCNLNTGQRCVKIGWTALDVGLTVVGGKAIIGGLKLAGLGIKTSGICKTVLNTSGGSLENSECFSTRIKNVMLVFTFPT